MIKYVSILGDSISTYEGFVPPGYAVFYEGERRMAHGLTSVNDTWWARVNQQLRANICVNNSYSGSLVSGGAFPAAESDVRTAALHTAGAVPDMILLYIGFNDFGYAIPVIGAAPEKGFFTAYLSMLQRLKANYPASRIVCGTLMKSYMRDDPDWTFPHDWCGASIHEYNAAIKIAAYQAGVELADLDALGIRYESLDGTHPTAEGHKTLAEAWLLCLEKRKAGGVGHE